MSHANVSPSLAAWHGLGGLWHDFDAGDGGDIIDLYAVVKGFNSKTQFKKLLRDIERHIGAVSQPQRKPNKIGALGARETTLILSVSKADTGGKRRGLRVWNVSGPIAKMELYRWLKLEWPTDEQLQEGVGERPKPQ